MKFNAHSNLQGQHAFLSASSYHWLNYDLDKLTDRYLRHQAVQRGTDLHDLACSHIRLGVKMPKTKRTLDMYVNDALLYHMKPEVVLYYSNNCFGTADAISFKDGFLRIHDLKTGETDTSFHQLEIYAALFCLEYRYKPEELTGIELRIYQNNEVRIAEPSPDDIQKVMDTIILFDKQIESLKLED
jgi:hypothetical protein